MCCRTPLSCCINFQIMPTTLQTQHRLGKCIEHTSAGRQISPHECPFCRGDVHTKLGRGAKEICDSIFHNTPLSLSAGGRSPVRKGQQRHTQSRGHEHEHGCGLGWGTGSGTPSFNHNFWNVPILLPKGTERIVWLRFRGGKGRGKPSYHMSNPGNKANNTLTLRKTGFLVVATWPGCVC